MGSAGAARREGTTVPSPHKQTIAETLRLLQQPQMSWERVNSAKPQAVAWLLL